MRRHDDDTFWHADDAGMPRQNLPPSRYLTRRHALRRGPPRRLRDQAPGPGVQPDVQDGRVAVVPRSLPGLPRPELPVAGHQGPVTVLELPPEADFSPSGTGVRVPGDPGCCSCGLPSVPDAAEGSPAGNCERGRPRAIAGPGRLRDAAAACLHRLGHGTEGSGGESRNVAADLLPGGLGCAKYGTEAQVSMSARSGTSSRQETVPYLARSRRSGT